MGDVSRSELGKKSRYPARYAPEALYPIARSDGRERLGIGTDVPFSGVDLWTAWEMSWLDPRGKPMVAVGEFEVPAASPNVVESKSVKLYLNSLNAERFESAGAVEEVLGRDLSAAAGAPVRVRLHALAALPAVGAFDAECVDGLDVDIATYSLDASLLHAEPAETVEESLCSHLLRSNCPVTDQPDWASVLVRYRGPRISRAGLLRYVVSFRDTAEFHEHCVERIFTDVRQRCRPERLTVYARFTRRGGIDINPFRSDFEDAPAPLRLVRQ